MILEASLTAAAEKIAEAAIAAVTTVAVTEIANHADEIACTAVDVAGDVICAPLNLANDFLDYLNSL